MAFRLCKRPTHILAFAGVQIPGGRRLNTIWHDVWIRPHMTCHETPYHMAFGSCKETDAHSLRGGGGELGN
jgi:hypothetical protein